MKILSSLLLSLSLTGTCYAQAIRLTDYDWEPNDIAELGLKKEELFRRMDRDLIKVGTSICSNRALMWAHDFKRHDQVDAGKIFLFYTQRTGEVGRKTWWYHVAPVVNEKGGMFVMDAGFPSAITTPLAPEEWMHAFIGSPACKEIRAGENELIDRMFRNRVFPEKTVYGTFDCYYKIVPAGYWTPSSVAMNLLQADERGNPVRFVRDEINPDEVYTACTEAATNALGSFLGSGKKKCRKFLSR